MELHFILLFLAVTLFLFSIDKNNYKIAILLLAVVFFGSTFLLSAFRAETVGNDTIRYVNFTTPISCRGISTEKAATPVSMQIPIGWVTLRWEIIGAWRR